MDTPPALADGDHDIYCTVLLIRHCQLQVLDSQFALEAATTLGGHVTS